MNPLLFSLYHHLVYSTSVPYEPGLRRIHALEPHGLICTSEPVRHHNCTYISALCMPTPVAPPLRVTMWTEKRDCSTLLVSTASDDRALFMLELTRKPKALVAVLRIFREPAWFFAFCVRVYLLFVHIHQELHPVGLPREVPNLREYRRLALFE